MQRITDYCQKKGYTYKLAPEANCQRADISHQGLKTIVKIYATGTVLIQGPTNTLKEEFQALFGKTFTTSIAEAPLLISETSSNPNMIKVFTDGACSVSKRIGAAATLIRYPGKPDETYISGRTDTTNNQEELTAVKMAIQALPVNIEIELSTDSNYVIGVLSRKFKATKNIDLINEIVDLIKKKNINITWIWIKGHNGHPENEICDKLARDHANKLLKEHGEKI